MQESLESEETAAHEAAGIDLIAEFPTTPYAADFRLGYIKYFRDVANTPEKREQYLSIAYKKACDMDVLMEKLFYFSNLETGRLPIAPVESDLGAFAREFAQSVRNELAERGIRIAAEVTSVPHPVLIDVDQMRRVLMNLTENVAKHASADFSRSSCPSGATTAWNICCLRITVPAFPRSTCRICLSVLARRRIPRCCRRRSGLIVHLQIHCGGARREDRCQK